MKNIRFDHLVAEEELIIFLQNIEFSKNGNKLDNRFIKRLENIAKINGCIKISIPSDLSKKELSFWLTNNFEVEDNGNKKIIKKVLNSNKPDNYIFDIEGMSTVLLYKDVS